MLDLRPEAVPEKPDALLLGLALIEAKQRGDDDAYRALSREVSEDAQLGDDLFHTLKEMLSCGTVVKALAEVLEPAEIETLRASALRALS